MLSQEAANNQRRCILRANVRMNKRRVAAGKCRCAGCDRPRVNKTYCEYHRLLANENRRVWLAGLAKRITPAGEDNPEAAMKHYIADSARTNKRNKRNRKESRDRQSSQMGLPPTSALCTRAD